MNGDQSRTDIHLFEANDRLSLPERLGRYRIIQKIGAGGMGDVYLAEDEVLRRRVAVKVLPPEVAADTDRVSRFQREARAVAGLNHANIVTIHDYGIDGGRHFFVTEYVAGTTLRDLMGAASNHDDVIEIA